MICCPLAYSSSLTQFYPPYLVQILGCVVTCGNKMMHFSHGWCWQPPQTASRLHIRHIQSDWAHWYAIHGHTVSALDSYTHPAWLRFWGSGLLAESKWWGYVMVEADSHLKLLPKSILIMHKILATLICCPLACGSSLTQFYPGYLAQIFGFWVTCGVKIMWLCHGWGWQPLQTASHIHIKHV